MAQSIDHSTSDAGTGDDSVSSAVSAECAAVDSTAVASTASSVENTQESSQSFVQCGDNERYAWGQALRVAMACTGADSPGFGPDLFDTGGDACKRSEGGMGVRFPQVDAGQCDSWLPDAGPVSSEAIDQLRQRLHALASGVDTHLATLVELLVRFDELEGWRGSGAKHCVAWMNNELGIHKRLACEQLRVGRALRSLPVMRSLFRVGRLGWSKIRLLTRVANADNEHRLAHVALDASVSDVERLCREIEWPSAEPGDESGKEGEGDGHRALRQYLARRFTWTTRADGCVDIRLVLPPDLASNYMKALEPCEDALYEPDANLPDVEITPSQRRADAAVLMAERSLASQGEEFVRADRYQVILSVDADQLAQSQELTDSPADHGADARAAENSGSPGRRPVMESAMGALAIPVASDTARRISCDATIMPLATSGGEPVSIGRKSRLWPRAMRRAIIARDRHCQYPGCDSSRNLDIHHVRHWADGGETSVENGACVCRAHHVALHEGGYDLERIPVREQDEFKRQWLPTRTRFRVVRRHAAGHATKAASHDVHSSQCEHVYTCAAGRTNSVVAPDHAVGMRLVNVNSS